MNLHLLATTGALAAACLAHAAAPGTAITVYTAKEIVTMDAGWPDATCVAVQDGRILSVGRSMADLQPWLDAAKRDGTAVAIDETFKDRVLVPGFIEAHGHPLIGAIAVTRPLLSHYPQPMPYGPDFPGVKDLAEAESTMKAYLAANPDDGRLVVFWGYDVVAMGRHLDAAWLDRVGGGRAVCVWDGSEHFVYASTAAMKQRGVTKADAKTNGVQVGAQGEPNGQFLGATAASWFLAPELGQILAPAEIPGLMKFLVDLGWKKGITTTSDMSLGMVAGIEAEATLTKQFFNSPAAPLRCVSITAADVAEREKATVAEAVAYVRSLEARSDDKVVFRGVKFFADDAFLSFGMQVVGPGYTDGRQGLWMIQPSEMVARYRPWWEAGMQLHTHTNGNAGVKAVIDALAGLQEIKPRFDHRFAIQHYGISTPEDAFRLARLGGVASVNPSYVHQRGDINKAYIGTDRAETAARLKTLISAGVLTAMHNDTPVAPPDPLSEMWIAVNRIGIDSGKVLAPAERVTPYEALRMVTIDAAATLGVEDRVGSIRTGKFADFTVLESNPLKVDAMKIRDIPVWGVVIGGAKHPVTDIKPLAKPKALPAATSKPSADARPSPSPTASDVRPLTLAERYGNNAALSDIDALSRHMEGCRLEFWRAFSRNAEIRLTVE